MKTPFQLAQSKNTFVTGCLILAVLLEVYAHCVLLYQFDKDVVAVTYFIAGVAIAIIPLLGIRNDFLAESRVPAYLTWGFLGFVVFLVIRHTTVEFAAKPLDYKMADMLPVIETMAQRFLEGEPVYERIPEIWKGIQPIYLPAMWLPVVISQIFGFDPRWIVVTMFLIALAVALRVWNVQASWVSLVALLPVWWIAQAVVYADPGFLVLTQEGIVICYYVLLAVAITSRNPYFTGLAAALCLTSRFSLVFWVLAFAVYLLVCRQYRYLLRAGSVCAVTVLILMVITGAIWHLDVFLGLDQTYLNAVRPNNEWKLGPLLQEGLGLARFWDYADLRSLYSVFILSSVIAPVLCFGLHYAISRRVDLVILPLCALKLSLVVFYNLILIPAGYLFYTSTILSLALLYYCLNPGKGTLSETPRSHVQI